MILVLIETGRLSNNRKKQINKTNYKQKKLNR